MKLFMEINPQLFDDCSHVYTEQQNSAAARKQMRERKWESLAEQASKRKSLNGSGSSSSAPPDRFHTNPMPRLEEVDATHENQKRLDSLKLQDGDRSARRAPVHERQGSIGSSRSQR